MSYTVGTGLLQKCYMSRKAWIPRKCFVCGERGGWGKKNVNGIYRGAYKAGMWIEHFHPNCLKDIICCPGNYKNEDVHHAVYVRELWEKIQLRKRMEKKEKELDLKKAQKEICKGG